MSNKAPEKVAFRVVMIGDSQVGKTSLVQRFVNGRFEVQTKSTVGAVFHTYEGKFNTTPVAMQIWDTAGQEKYRSLGPIYYRDAVAGVAVYDLTAEDPFPSLQRWIDDFGQNTSSPDIFIVGNKADLVDGGGSVSEEAALFAQRNGATLLVASAKTGENVEEVFGTIFRTLAEKQIQKHVVQQPDLVRVEETSSSSKSKCC